MSLAFRLMDRLEPRSARDTSVSRDERNLGQRRFLDELRLNEGQLGRHVASSGGWGQAGTPTSMVETSKLCTSNIRDVDNCKPIYSQRLLLQGAFVFHVVWVPLHNTACGRLRALAEKKSASPGGLARLLVSAVRASAA